MSRVNLKRSFVDDFLDKEAKQTKMSINGIRMELARTQNRKDREYQNMLKSKERAKKALERRRENEASYQAACDDEDRLKQLLDDTDRDILPMDSNGTTEKAVFV
jgi:hypothetical protein